MATFYFSHSYRDTEINDYFLNLMHDRGLMPTIDAPSGSNNLNSAKLERQLNSTKGMIAIIPWREGGLSDYISYEILMGVRSGKPVLVFMDDTLPTGLFPQLIAEERFSARSYWREGREHLQRIDEFLSFVGKAPTPRLRIGNRRRYAALIGLDALPSEAAAAIKETIHERQYDVMDMSEIDFDPKSVDANVGIIRGANIAVAFNSGTDVAHAYYLGIARAALTPTIVLESNQTQVSLPTFPTEFGARLVPLNDMQQIKDTLNHELSIFEDEPVIIDQQDEINKYIEFLKQSSATPGNYDSGLRATFVNQFRDLYTDFSAGAVGSGSTNISTDTT
jgi:hypothetical protein